MLWLDLTRKCQLSCSHCYNSSGPTGDHGTMTGEDWTRVLDQAAACGVERIQLIGGEPTLHPHAVQLVDHALSLGLHVEIFSNLVAVSASWWRTFQQPGVSLATSYYSDQADQHNAITGRPTHARTRANIRRAVSRGIPIRVGIVDTGDGQRVDEARRALEVIGVGSIRVDRVRSFGRASGGQAPDAAALCGRCGSGKASIGPDGAVSPCVMSAWMSVGNVHDQALADILGGAVMAEATATIRTVAQSDDGCDPDDECSPGTPLSGCNPRN
ncbi:radical SAM/SPASM domain-containing protein [Actinomadura miaoliensis]|uniref:Radical SAM protein n=1 Tax=Actinomadura miaoliensis TaxID=430685 RepID=A0ABP7X6M1_9ACTN